MPDLKQELLQQCLQYADARIKAAEDAIAAANEASRDDTKSSAGDKYETTRERMQQEIDRNEAQLYEAGKLKHALLNISAERSSGTVQSGSVVLTDKGNFFIAVSAGKIALNDNKYLAISPVSPIGKMLMGKKRGDEFNFNGKVYKVLEVV